MDYLEIVNHPYFKSAHKTVNEAIVLLLDMGMTLEQARGWIKAWVSGAGDGSE